MSDLRTVTNRRSVADRSAGLSQNSVDHSTVQHGAAERSKNLIWRSISVLFPVIFALATSAIAQQPELPKVDLSQRQSSVADRFGRLEELLIRLADMEAAENPQRAALLRRAAKQSRDRFVQNRLVAASQSLAKQQYGEAVESQNEAKKELAAILTLLMSEDRGQRIRDEKKRIQKIVRELKRTLNNQRGTRARTENGAELKELRGEQSDVTRKGEQLSKELNEDTSDSMSSDPGKSNDPGEPGKTPENDQDSKETPESDEKKDSKSTESKPGEKSESPEEDGSPEAGGEPKDSKPSSDSKSPSESKPSSDSKPPAESKPSEQSKPNPSGDSKPSDSSKPPSESNPSNQSQSQPQSDSQSPPQDSPKSPQDAARQQLEQAIENMRKAQQELDDSDRQAATAQQREAEERLREAIDQLERILRQLREEEMERELARLEGRIKNIAAMQTKVLEKTRLLAATPKEQRDRSVDIKAGELSFSEKKITLEVDRALLLLREEGSSVALPEVLGAVRDDTVVVAGRLSKSQIDEATQLTMEGILESLEEVMEALAKARKKLQEQQQQSQQQQQGSPGEQEKPLVEQIAELKLLRTLETRIRNSTDRFSDLLESGDASAGEMLRNLSDRQDRLYRITRDLVLKRNQ